MYLSTCIFGKRLHVYSCTGWMQCLHCAINFSRIILCIWSLPSNRPPLAVPLRVRYPVCCFFTPVHRKDTAVMVHQDSEMTTAAWYFCVCVDFFVQIRLTSCQRILRLNERTWPDRPWHQSNQDLRLPIPWNYLSKRGREVILGG